ncbi:hypothetical protein Skr01_03470 [Sphaerisporangium krabiense]|nr:hypothetical protein Skr01_03470 [Sphaerisporangium krabiense]
MRVSDDQEGGSAFGDAHISLRLEAHHLPASCLSGLTAHGERNVRLRAAFRDRLELITESTSRVLRRVRPPTGHGARWRRRLDGGKSQLTDEPLRFGGGLRFIRPMQHAVFIRLFL